MLARVMMLVSCFLLLRLLSELLDVEGIVPGHYFTRFDIRVIRCQYGGRVFYRVISGQEAPGPLNYLWLSQSDKGSPQGLRDKG